MAITTLTELNDLAKDYYSNVYINLVNPETPLKAQFAGLEGATFTGRKWIFGVKGEYGGGAANAGANKTLPAATEGSFDQGDANVIRTYTRMALDGLVIEVTKRREGSYRPALAEVMQDRLTAHDLDVNRQMFNHSDGKLGTLLTDSGTTQVMKDAYGVVDAGTGTKFIYPGDQIRFYDSTLTTGRTVGTVTSVDHANESFVLDTDPVSTATDVAVKATADTDNKQGEAGGLLESVSDSDDNFENIDTGVTTRWSSFVLSNSGTARPPSDSLVMQMIETIRARSRQTPNLVVTTPGIVLKYSEIFLPLRRLDGQDVQLRGGYKPIAGIIHAGGVIPVIADADCPQQHMFFLNTAAFRMADVVGTEWAELDGATFDRVDDKDAISGYIRKYWNLITVKRNANGLLKDLNDISTIERQH